MRYSGAKVLVTGADGFIGSHLTEALVAEGANVRAFCLYNSQGSRGWLDRIDADKARNIEFLLGDIRDPRFVDTACAGVDVFYLAALIAIPYSYAAPETPSLSRMRETRTYDLNGDRVSRTGNDLNPWYRNTT